MKAPFAYYGGKMRLADRIVRLMPPHRVYIEPFFGSGAVFFAKDPVMVEIVNDINDEIVAFFSSLRDNPEELERLCRLSPHARTEFNACIEATDDPMEKARRFWVRVNQSFAKTGSDHTGWSITTARSQSIPGSIRNRIGRFADAAERLQNTTVEKCDAADLVERLATHDTVIYADPPYLNSTRSGRARRQTYGDYANDMGDDESHRRLAKALHATPASVILSGYPSDLYDELYGDWHQIDIPVLAHSSNSVTASRGQRTEVLWLNYDPEPSQLQLWGDFDPPAIHLSQETG